MQRWAIIAGAAQCFNSTHESHTDTENDDEREQSLYYNTHFIDLVGINFYLKPIYANTNFSENARAN